MLNDIIGILLELVHISILGNDDGAFLRMLVRIYLGKYYILLLGDILSVNELCRVLLSKSGTESVDREALLSTYNIICVILCSCSESINIIVLLLYREIIKLIFQSIGSIIELSVYGKSLSALSTFKSDIYRIFVKVGIRETDSRSYSTAVSLVNVCNNKLRRSRVYT